MPSRLPPLDWSDSFTGPPDYTGSRFQKNVPGP